jgi:hypothetical protein
MSRSGYSDDCEGGDLYRGAVASAIRGKRGQAFLKEMLQALDALPEKTLIDYDLKRDGQFCAIGAVGHARGVDMSDLDPEDIEHVAATFGIAAAMAREIVYENDEANWRIEMPEQRFERMRTWISQTIR